MRSEIDAIDLLDTAGAPVLKRLAPVAGGGLLLLLVILLIRRLRADRARERCAVLQHGAALGRCQVRASWARVARASSSSSWRLAGSPPA